MSEGAGVQARSDARVWIGEAEGELVGYAKNVIELVAPMPLAPGQPARFTVEGLALEGRSLGSRKREDGRFQVRIRLVSLRREQRLALEGLADLPTSLGPQTER